MSKANEIVELIRQTSSTLPEDVLKALKAALRKEEKGSSAAVVLKTILDNCAIAAKRGTPLCQDTGTLTFFVDEKLRRKVTPETLKEAVAIATEKGYLRKNTIDSISGKSHDDNVCEGAPVVHYVEAGPTSPVPRPSSVTLVMKGGGSENMSRQYSLPDATLGAGRDLEGVRKCVLDAVQKIQGYGCAPGILGVCIGGDRATGYEVAKEQLLRALGNNRIIECSNNRMVECSNNRIIECSNNRMVECSNNRMKEDRTTGCSDERMEKLEKRLLREANELGIGPMGLGGKTTLLGVKIASRPRVPASFFVTVAYMCWACRRRTIEL